MKPQAPAARRYARALHGLAVANQAADQVRADLSALSRALADSPDLARFLGDYMVPSGSRARAMAALFESRVHALTWRFLRFLESKRRLSLLGDIARVYEADEETRSGVLRATLTAAIALDEGRVRTFTAQASRTAGRPVVLSTRTDTGLMGGFRVQIGDKVYDYSLAARLRLARAALAEGQGTKR